MTELEKIAYAKTYIEKLANGINPLTDQPVPDSDSINNVRISRCLFYVSDLLRQIVENGGVSQRKTKTAKVPFQLVYEARKKFCYSETPIPISEITRRINELIQSEDMKKLNYKSISDWLIQAGFLVLVTNDDGSTTRKPTDNGIQMGITLEQRLHAKNKTTLLETWSVYKDRRPLIEHLKEILEKEGFVLKPRNLEEVYKKIVATGKDKYIFKLILFMMKFIEQYKTTGYDSGGFGILRRKTDNPRTLLFLDIAEQVYLYYQAVLKQRNQIDFADMINDAHFYLQEIERQNITLPYRYIIIDEFQDIARQRFNLTKRLSEITQAKVVAVGDDWQSIYAFSGSDITLFTRFLDLMGAGTELKITHTYRNSQELIDIAGGFVQKNSAQIRKQLISPKHLDDPIKIVPFDDQFKPMNALAVVIEQIIGEIIDEFGVQRSILLIGRYNYDMHKLYRTGHFEELPGGRVKSEKYPNANISFMTAHSSKGLGYDNVILINMFEGKFGFPCQIEDDPIMKLVTYEDTSMPFAEERRLFYVAMTRTKNRVYIATPKNKPSRFLVELIKDFNIPHADDINMQVVDLFSLRCPICGFPLKYEFNKNYGLNLWICTNDAEVCDFMTNDRVHKHDICKCPQCKDGYLIVKVNPKNNSVFYGCTNYYRDTEKCRYMQPLPNDPI